MRNSKDNRLRGDRVLCTVGLLPSVVAARHRVTASPGVSAAVLADSALGWGRLSWNTIFVFELALT